MLGTIVRLYVGWRLFRLLRPLLAAALVAAAVLALRVHHAPMDRSAVSSLERGATAVRSDLSRALQRGFRPAPAQP
jgi:uncharacterized membrane protein